VALLIAVASTPALAQDAGPRRVSYGVELAYRSGHADRGYLISDRPVVQPVTWIDWNGAEFSAWGSVPLTMNSDGSRPQIVELELGREYTAGKFTITPAGRMWFYRNAVDGERDRSLEGWLYLSYNAGPISLFTQHSLDVMSYKGAYFVDAGIESEHEVASWLSIGGLLGAGAGSAQFNDAYFGVPISAVDRIRTEAWLTISANHFYIGPHIEYSTMVDRAVRAGAAKPDYFLIRLAVGGEF